MKYSENQAKKKRRYKTSAYKIFYSSQREKYCCTINLIFMLIIYHDPDIHVCTWQNRCSISDFDKVAKEGYFLCCARWVLRRIHRAITKISFVYPHYPFFCHEVEALDSRVTKHGEDLFGDLFDFFFPEVIVAVEVDGKGNKTSSCAQNDCSCCCE